MDKYQTELARFQAIVDQIMSEAGKESPPVDQNPFELIAHLCELLSDSESRRKRAIEALENHNRINDIQKEQITTILKGH